mgnify:CR=1 FL=1
MCSLLEPAFLRYPAAFHLAAWEAMCFVPWELNSGVFPESQGLQGAYNKNWVRNTGIATLLMGGAFVYLFNVSRKLEQRSSAPPPALLKNLDAVAQIFGVFFNLCATVV